MTVKGVGFSYGISGKSAEDAEFGLREAKRVRKNSPVVVNDDIAPSNIRTDVISCDEDSRQLSPMRVADYFNDPGSMGSEELIASLESFQKNGRKNPLTGLPVRELWLAREAEGLLGTYKANIDVDSLKWVNDELGHAQGDKLLGQVGKALGMVQINAHHISGAEFYAFHDDRDYLKTQLEKARYILRDVEFGNAQWYFRGAGFSYGISEKSARDAEYGLHADKCARVESGERVERGSVPSGAFKK